MRSLIDPSGWDKIDFVMNSTYFYKENRIKTEGSLSHIFDICKYGTRFYLNKQQQSLINEVYQVIDPFCIQPS